MRRFVAAFGVLAVLLVLSPGLEAYLKLGTRVGSGLVAIRWTSMPVRYYITNRDVPGVTAPQLQASVQRAFSTWNVVPSMTIAGTFGGFVGAEPFDDDGVSVIGFQSRPEMDRTLGATTFQIETTTGRIIESDIFINSAFPWSVASGGTSTAYDVESIAVHEVGHLLGMGHSALGETELKSPGRAVLGKAAVMFPIAFPRGNILDRSLKADDVAGISDIYANATTDGTLGAISGRVTLNGDPLFGAHVTAFNPSTGQLIAGFTLGTDGQFVISALPPGLYVVRVEPLDDADLTSFFDEDTVVNVSFKPTYYAKLVAVPAGGSSGSIEIQVQPK
jgi:Matrixin/Carboxypeptidase regulatory-like domain